MYRCSAELSVQTSIELSEGEHASLIDGHTRLILWQTDLICFLNTGFAPVVRLHDKHTHSVLFGNAAD